MRSFIVVTCLFLSLSSLHAQALTREWIGATTYEDMSDLLRRFPGMYAYDYGVAGAPLIFRPWGFAPWYIGVERDGIPWSRVSDGLYDSNLDLPEEVDSLSQRFDGSHPLATIRFTTRKLPTDTATTEVALREGYYGFGRIDFAHGQRLSKRLEGWGRGRLWWYDGLRQILSSTGPASLSDARFYNLSGMLRYAASTEWSTTIEYGGANVEARSPLRISGNNDRPQNYSEREYGTLRAQRIAPRLDLEFAVHARQDREKRGPYFRLREQFWYGYAQGIVKTSSAHLRARAAIERADYSYTGGGGEDSFGNLHISGAQHSRIGDVSARALLRQRLAGESPLAEDLPTKSLTAEYATPQWLSLQAIAGGTVGYNDIPQFWRAARFDITNRPWLVDDAFAEGSYYRGPRSEFESIDEFSSYMGMWHAGLRSERGTSRATLSWNAVYGDEPRFYADNDTVYLSSDYATDVVEQRGPSLECDAAILSFLRLQSYSHIALDADEIGRAVDTRSYSRLMFSRDFFQAPLRVRSYLAYEHIGPRRARSEIRAEVLGPAHLMHFRLEAAIHGVALIWGMENITGQHYEYLPGYMLIRKEEYFGLKWTLKL